MFVLYMYTSYFSCIHVSTCSRLYLRKAVEVQDASLYVGNLERGSLDLPELGDPVQIVELHSCFSLETGKIRRNPSDMCIHEHTHTRTHTHTHANKLPHTDTHTFKSLEGILHQSYC